MVKIWQIVKGQHFNVILTLNYMLGRRIVLYLKVRANAHNNTQHCWANIVVSCCAMCANARNKSQHVGSLDENTKDSGTQIPTIPYIPPWIIDNNNRHFSQPPPLSLMHCLIFFGSVLRN